MEEFIENAKQSIRIFAYEAFHQRLSAEPKMFNNPQIDKEMFEYKRERVHNFTEYINNAVYVTQNFLSAYFISYFKFYDTENSKSTFMKDFKSILLCWLNKRDNVFVKIIDSLAIMVEAIINCDKYTNYELNIKDIIECFTEFFEQHFASEFFQKGSWDYLNGKAKLWYQDLYTVLKNSDERKESCCEITKFLRISKVMFPVAESWFCDKCKDPNYKQMEVQVIYVRPNYNFLKCVSNRDFRKGGINAGENSDNEGKNSTGAGKYSTDTGKISVCTKTVTVGTEMNSIGTGKESTSTGKKYNGNTSVGTENCAVKLTRNAGRLSDGVGKESFRAEKESVDPGKEYTHGKDEYLVAKVAHIDGESAHTDSREQSNHAKGNSIFSFDKQEISPKSNVSKTLETMNSVNEIIYPKLSSDSSEVYISETTKETNQKLLETYFDKVCDMELTKNTDVYFVAQEYSHSVKNMINDVLSIQTRENLEFSELDEKTYKSNIRNFDESCFVFRSNTFICVGGNNFISEFDMKRESC